MKQQSLVNVKNMQSQNRIFSLVYLINSRSQGRQVINITFILLSLVGNLANFLSLKQVNIFKNQLFVLASIINIVFLVVFGLILLQLIFGYFYQIQFFISVQWKVFRFLIFPFLTCYLLQQSTTGQLFNTTLAMVLLAFIVCVSLLLTAIFSIQSYTYKKLLHRDLPINFYILLVQILLYVCSVIQTYNIKVTCALALTILALNIYKNNFSTLTQNDIQYRILAVSAFLLLWYGMVLLISLFSSVQSVTSLLIASVPCLIYKIISDFTRQRAPVPYKNFVAIFQDPDTINFQQFIQSVQPIIQQIMQYYYSDHKKDFVQTLLISYYYEHSNRCLNMDCPFKNEDYKYQLKNMNDSKNMKEVLFKICKKIDYLYYGMYKVWPQHIDLKLSLVQFYIFCYPNKVRALEIISEIQLTKLSLQQEYELFRVKILCQTMTNLEVVGQIKLDEKLVEFENLVYLTLNTMMEFWSLFYQEKIDFNKLTSITAKIFPMRKKIQQIFLDRLSQQTFSSLQILKLYSLYCATIQNDQDKSWKIKDYLQKLRCKLEQHKQIQYLSFDSEIGLVALSLSDNKLGNIAMVNSQASIIFNYSKKQFKTIKVNEIMPKTFAQQHDNYLKVFLQHKNKKVNSDQRRLFGKNKAGYIFPILLQLQRTVSSTGDELLFIANIKKYKLQQSSVTCVTDQQGQICDISASFDYFFFKDQKINFKKTGQHKNIQQFIPQFFDPNIQEDENTRFKHFKTIMSLKHFGRVQVQYTVSAVTFPLKANGGFIVQGKVKYEQKPLQFPHISMTQSLRTMMNRQILSGHKTYYNPQLNRFQFSKTQQSININDQFNKQFTIPFININDVTNIFGVKKQHVDYGEKIKTIRLVKDHFERVQQESQFESQLDQKKTQSVQAMNQIIQFKQSISKQQKPTFMRNIKLILLSLTVVCFVLFLLLISSYSQYSSSNRKVNHQIKYKYQTKGYLTQYIIYYTALESGFDQAQYAPMLQSTKSQLINTIEISPIQQFKKQQILKIVYLQNQADLTDLLNKETLEFHYGNSQAINQIIKLWIIVFAFILLLIFITVSTYFLFLGQLQSVYQIFLCLQQKIIKKLHVQCKNLSKKIQVSTQKQKAERRAEETEQAFQKQQDINEDDDENPVKKIRKFKQNQRFRNVWLFLKLIFPFTIIIILSIYTVVQLSAHNERLLSQGQIYKQIYQIMPQTSIYLMDTFLRSSHNYTSEVKNNIAGSYQDIDQIIYDYQKKSPQDIDEDFFFTLMNNVCKSDNFKFKKISICDTISEGAITVGLSKAINYLVNSLTALRRSPSSANLIQNFNQLIVLEYDFIFPIVQEMASRTNEQLDKQTASFESQYSTFTIFVIILVIINFIYFLRYPAYEIEQKILLTKGLIDLLPASYKKQTTRAKQGEYQQIQQGG